MTIASSSTYRKIQKLAGVDDCAGKQSLPRMGIGGNRQHEEAE